MQKTFIKYTFIIMTAAILLILSIHFLFSLHSLESQQFNTFYTKTEQMIHTLENNRWELQLLNESLNEDYLTRARAAAYVLDNQNNGRMSVSQMRYLADLLNVDELHVIDENGIIVSASVAKYIGIDMADHKQTSAFLSILKSNDENAYLIQNAQPNAAENKIMQYVGVARKAQKGIVQVGFEPTRQLDAISRNTYDYIFSKFPTDVGEELFVVDTTTGAVLGHSNGLGMDFTAECYQLDHLRECDKGAYKKDNSGQLMYITTRFYGDVLLCTAYPRSILMQKLWKNIIPFLFYLIFIEAAVILLLNYLVKQNVINGIHHIIRNLYGITNGNLDTIVSVGGNNEFEKLSAGINTMVKSIINLSNRISAIIEVSGIPLAAFEYERGVNRMFTTSGLRELLNLSDARASQLYKYPYLFDQYIQRLTRVPIEGEEDIFQVNDSKYVRIHLSETSGGYLGIITDVTKDVLQKQQMQYENTHDPLTDLYKFEPFKRHAADILAKMPADKVCAIVMFDLDHFKTINDSFGHDAGDKYLQSFAEIMHTMPADHFLCARRSGDEFCMMLYNCGSRAELITYMDSFYESLNQSKVALSETETKVISASGGFAWTDNPQNDISDLLSYADEALYEVKRSTKGYYSEYKNICSTQ